MKLPIPGVEPTYYPPCPPPKCRSCKAPIRWAITTNGKRIPLDAEPNAKGNIALEYQQGDVPTAIMDPTYVSFRATRYTSHFATCPNAAEHRKPR